MTNLEISLNYSSDNCEEVLADLTAEFEKQTDTHASIHWMNWGEAWTEFMKISLYRHGPVVSEVGNTWTPSLSASNSLRSFKEKEFIFFGGKGAFLDEVSKSCVDPDTGNIVAIPWTLGTYMLFYRRDLLEKAGIDETTAFTTMENFYQTLEKLQQSGLKHPFVVSTEGQTLGTVHNIASWIWGAGGDFFNTKGNAVIFSSPETRAGMRQYFELHRFFPERGQRAEGITCWELFLNGEAAITLYNQAYLFNIEHGQIPPELIGKIGATVPPGVPFIGASNLVIWKHVPLNQENAALQLIQFMTSSDFLMPQFERTGVLPARLNALNRIESPLYAPAIEALKKGRSFPHVRLWGLVEDKLAVSLNQIWSVLFDNPKADVEKTIAEILDPLEERLNLTLSS
jgi:multiple sugar transport system substrate-binding protein